MRLNQAQTVAKQIDAAKSANIPFAFDLRSEAMGDKAASTALIPWLQQRYDIDTITVIEAENGRTPFMLRQYGQSDWEYLSLDAVSSHDFLDLHTAGLPLACLWEFNTMLAMHGIHTSLQREQSMRSGVVFAILTEARYNERRNMNLDCGRKSIDELRSRGHEVTILMPHPDPMFPDAIQVSTDDAIEQIANAACFIGGDTGFSHIAAACGTPTVAIYPDYYRYQKGSLSKCEAIAEWWDAPELRWAPTSTLPNTELLYPVVMGTDHWWSIEHVCKQVERAL